MTGGLYIRQLNQPVRERFCRIEQLQRRGGIKPMPPEVLYFLMTSGGTPPSAGPGIASRMEIERPENPAPGARLTHVRSRGPELNGIVRALDRRLAVGGKGDRSRPRAGAFPRPEFYIPCEVELELRGRLPGRTSARPRTARPFSRGLQKRAGGNERSGVELSPT